MFVQRRCINRVVLFHILVAGLGVSPDRPGDHV